MRAEAPMVRRICRAAGTSVLLAIVASSGSGVAEEKPGRAVRVRFELNDAQVKGRALAGVLVRASLAGSERAAGVTGSDGRFSAELVPGSYQVSYRLQGYVPYTSGGTEIREDGQLVTVSLSRLLEATESGQRDVRIILNWGSRPDQVRDADSHIACPCGAEDRHVYYEHKRHAAGDHRVELDVDDTDWGGPETITLTHPAPGSYLYWVRDFSGPPATLGRSDVVVRVVIGTEEAGEFRAFQGVTRRSWRPFKAVEVDARGRPTLVRFTPDEIAEAADLDVPVDLEPKDPSPTPVIFTPEPTPAAAGAEPAGARPIPVYWLLLLALVLFVLTATRLSRRGGGKS
jgi:hypothetical protein